MRFVKLAAVVVLASGCTWVSLTPEGRQVQIGYAGNVQECKLLGKVKAKTQSRVMVDRSDSTVQSELYSLARNEAATMGAANLVMHGLPSDDGSPGVYGVPLSADELATRHDQNCPQLHRGGNSKSSPANVGQTNEAGSGYIRLRKATNRLTKTRFNSGEIPHEQLWVGQH